MKPIFLLLAVVLISTSGCSQTSAKKGETKKYTNVGGSCEGCEGVHEYTVPVDSLKNKIWLPDWNEGGRKIAVNGVVYKPNGEPAPNVIIYIYHTDQTGIYPTRGDEKGWGKRHGFLRGWIKTNEKGEYKFFTLRPAAYPGRRDPEHIHASILEPDKNAYWIDDFVFDDDPLVTESQRKNAENRGGSGILKLKDVGNMFTAERNIYLGKNVPNYPK